MSSIFCIANQKGGVGKTTTAIHLAMGLARSGRRCLLIDLDAQGNASSIFVESPDPERSSYAIFKDKRLITDVACKTRESNLDVVPAVIHLAEVETLLAGAVDGFFRLQESFQGADYDFVVVDCPPNLGLLTVNAFVASTHLIVPLQTAKFSLDGIRTILDMTRTVQKRFNASLSVLGALLTMFDGRTAISQAVAEPIGEHLPVFKTKISRSVAVEEAHLLKKTIFEYQPRNKVAKEYVAFTEEVRLGVQERQAR
ncbi:MAG: ParA family protein [Spirochaetia bacterium]|nr:ParA family protein [Spirochaetia bacterium]